jgi:hypothetical protein
MKLLINPGKVQNGHVGQSQEYTAAVQYFHELHRSGLTSLEVLQAGICLATYELGHALLPAAYSTIAACVSYALCLGFSWPAVSMAAVQKQIDGDEEEHLRIWWAIYLLER